MSYLRNQCLIQGTDDFLLFFLLERFIALALRYNSYIHFYIHSDTFACGYEVVPASFVDKMFFPSLNCLGIFVEIS